MDIKLKDFEGPLDLLLHLVSKYEMDIYDVPIVEVIEQYLAYISTLQAMRLEVAGEYMVMASQLMLIKSRKLLPKVVEETPLEEDPEQELLSQLEEYQRYKVKGLLRPNFLAKSKREVPFWTSRKIYCSRNFWAVKSGKPTWAKNSLSWLKNHCRE